MASALDSSLSISPARKLQTEDNKTKTNTKCSVFRRIFRPTAIFPDTFQEFLYSARPLAPGISLKKEFRYVAELHPAAQLMAKMPPGVFQPGQSLAFFQIFAIES